MKFRSNIKENTTATSELEANEILFLIDESKSEREVPIGESVYS